jgi:hypothetical protein
MDKKLISRLAALSLALIILAAMPIAASDVVRHSLSDVRVLYVFDDPGEIDWPTIYYLNDNYGCRIDLVTLYQRGTYHRISNEIVGKRIHLHECYVDSDDTTAMQTLTDDLFDERRADIVLFSPGAQTGLFEQLSDFLVALPIDSTRLFDLVKIYVAADGDASQVDTMGVVILNPYELGSRYKSRMKYEIPELFEWYRHDAPAYAHQSRYRAILNRHRSLAADVDFLSGLQTLRLATFVDELFDEGPMRRTFQQQARRFISSFRASQTTVGQRKTDHILRGYRELRLLREAAEKAGSGARLDAFRAYLSRLAIQAEEASLEAAGIAWTGRISLRDSPHGPRLKFALTVSVNGPREVELSQIHFNPHWDTAAIVLDSNLYTITPHQSFVRELLVEVDREHLETQQPESLFFSAMLTYGKIPLVLEKSMALRSQPNLELRFDPAFCLMPPVGGVDVDRIVTSTVLHVIIDKPRDFTGTVGLELETPRGIFAGAYRQEVELVAGETRESVRIPFTVSNLMELGRQHAVASLVSDGLTLAQDTAALRLARCHIADTLSIGFLPDSSGLLEDILRMTDARFRPLTNRALETADLSAYDVIIVGSGAYRTHPAFRTVHDQLRDFLRWGGSLVVFGQDLNWPDGSLPFSLAPTIEYLGQGDIETAIPDARILSKPYKVSPASLLDAFGRRRVTSPAVISPAERVFQTTDGAALLSISRLGSGQMIYCGLPLLEMVAELDLEAIHLIANILNY